MSQTRVAMTVPANTFYVDSKTTYTPLPFEAEAAITPGNFVGKGTSTGLIKPGATGGGVTVPLGVAGDNNYSYTSTGAAVDPTTTQFAIGQSVPVISHGRMKVLGDASSIVSGCRLMLSATAGSVALWTGTPGYTIGTAVTDKDGSGYLVMEVNIAYSA